MRSENIVRSCLNYFNAFNELANCQNKSEYLIASLKIVSYSLIFPPLIVGCLYFYHKKIALLESSFDGLIDNTAIYKTHQVFHEIHYDNSKSFKQKDIVQCLFIKVSNLNYEDLNTDKGKAEIERFKKGFKLLNLEKQHDFFVKLLDSGLMAKFLDMDLIPKDIKELNFTLGESKFQDLNSNDSLAIIFFDKLKEFKSLKKIRLDLKGLGFFGPAASQSLSKLTKNFQNDKIDFFYSPTRNNTMIERNGVKYYYTDRASPISNAMIQLRKFIDHANKNGKHFEYHLEFINLMIHGDNKVLINSWENSETFRKKNQSFTDEIISFLNNKDVLRKV